MQPGRPENGQVVPLMVIVVSVALLIIAGLGRLGATAAGRAAAQSAADAVALAAAAGGEEAARSVARANGVELLEHRVVGSFVQVEVIRHGRRAIATAQRQTEEPQSSIGPALSSGHGGTPLDGG